MRIIAVVLMALALALPGSAARPRPAALELESTTPLVVQGVRFGAREPVVLTLAAERLRRTTALRASTKGTFATRFRRVRLDRCVSFTVRAVGARGSRAVLRFAPGC